MLLFYLSLIDEQEDKEKFEKLYYKYRILMFATAKNIFSDNRLAEEAVQESFIKIAKVMGQIGDVDSHKTRNFTVIVTKNTCLDMLEKEKRHTGIISFDEIQSYDATEDFDLASIEKKDFIRIIGNLPDEDRDIILMKYYYAYKEKEIADLLGISYQAARKRVQRAKDRLAKYLVSWRQA